MTANVNSIAWVKSRGEPWHSLGTPVERLMTSQDAMKEGGLDWDVQCVPVYTSIGETKRMVPNKFATVRTDSYEALGIVGNNYVPIQNRDAFSFFDSVLSNWGAKYEVVGSLGRGENVWMIVNVGDVIKIKKSSDDVVKRYILLTNNHDGTRCLKMFITPIRVVCWNTLSAAMSGSRYDALGNKNDGVSIRHTVNATQKIEMAQKTLGLATEFYSKLSGYFNVLAEKDISAKWMKSYAKALISPPRKGVYSKKKQKVSTQAINAQNRIVELLDHETNRLPGIRGTAWAAYNAATFYADHMTRASGLGRATDSNVGDERRLSNVWFGNGANFKVRALNTALAMIK